MTLARLSFVAILGLGVVACSGDRSGGPASSTSASGPIGHYKVGRPYQIAGRWYYPEYEAGYNRVGTASWYGDAFHGRPTANGERFDKNRISAAHPTLPLPSVVKVTNLENGRSLTLRVNDRGPFVGDRLIDLSEAAADELGFRNQGLARVRVEFIDLAPDATGTPPQPTTRVASASPATAAAEASRVPRSEPRSLRPAEPAPVQLARAETAPAYCPVGGDQFVQVGAFRDTDRIGEAVSRVNGLEAVSIEPVIIAGSPAARVRLGPIVDERQASSVLAQVRARGFVDAFLAPGSAAERAAAQC